MKKLYPSYAPPGKWRGFSNVKTLPNHEWQALRLRVLERDDYTCVYCGYRSEKYQICDHIDGDPENNDEVNLQIVCQMCNLIKHSGQGCVIQGVVDLYTEAKYSQNDIIRITREMRDRGHSDEEIIEFLGLKGKTRFRMDRDYLKPLYGFVTDRPSRTGRGMYTAWKAYHESQLMRKQREELGSPNDPGG